MEWYHCTDDCETLPVYHCLDDNQLICGHHLKQNHLRHCFKRIDSREFQHRISLAAALKRSISMLSPVSLQHSLHTLIHTRIEEALQSYKSAFEEWIQVHRSQLNSLLHSVTTHQWPSALEAITQTLAEDYTAPLLRYEFEVDPVVMEMYPPDIDPPSEVVSNSMVEHQWKPGKTASFFKENRDKLHAELVKAWDNQQFQTITMKDTSEERDLLAAALLIAESKHTKTVILTRCGYSQTSVKWLSECLTLSLSAIKVLDISSNPLQDSGFAVLFPSIHRRGLSLLALRKTGLTDLSLPALTSLPTVKLDLSHNRFSIEGKVTLMSLHAENKV